MKRIISTMVASVMLFASLATTAFAADYTMTLSSNVNDAVKINDNVKVTAKISTNVGLQSIGFRIQFDPTVFELVEDEDARAYIFDDLFCEQEKAGLFMIDGIANESEEIESYYIPVEYAQAYYGYKSTARFGDPTIGTVIYDEDGGNAATSGKPAVRQTVGFQAARTSAVKATNEVTDMVLGGINLKVINDTVESSTLEIVGLGCTTDGTNFATIETTPLTIAIEGATTTYEVSAGTVENGTVALSAEGEVEENTVVNVTATPDEGYSLEGIYVNDVKIEGTAFVVTENVVVTAKFEKNYVAAKIDEVQDPAKDAILPTVPYTQGFKATVIPNSDSITGVTCTLKTAGKPDYVFDEWATFAIGKVETTFAINVLNVPAGVAVTAEWNASK